MTKCGSSHLRKDNFILAHSLREQSVMVEEATATGAWTAGPHCSRSQSKKGVLVLHICMQAGTSSYGTVLLTFSLGLPTSTKVIAIIPPQVCLEEEGHFRDSRPCQDDNPYGPLQLVPPSTSKIPHARSGEGALAGKSSSPQQPSESWNVPQIYSEFTWVWLKSGISQHFR